MPETAVKAHPFEVGDIVVNTWGYDQTNVDCYQVIRATAKSVRIAKIAKAGVPGSDGFMSNRVVPLKDQFVEPRRDEPAFLTKFPRSWEWNGETRWSLNFEYGGTETHVDGESYYCSWYA